MTGYASDLIPAICIVCGHHFPMDRHAVLACDGMVTCGCEVLGERPKSVDMCRPERVTGESQGQVARDCGTVPGGTNRAHTGKSSTEGE